MLIVSSKNKNTVVLHMPKCAGSSVRWAIMRSGKYQYRWSCDSAPIQAMPDQYKNYRRIGFIRSPTNWYLSKYYQAKKPKNSLLITRVLSDDWTLDYHKTLPRLLDLRQFLRDHPAYIKRIKKRVQDIVMNRYICWLAALYEDVESIAANDFGITLYDHWHNLTGMPTATIYKMDDSYFKAHFTSEFPGANLQTRNVGTYDINLSTKGAPLIYIADKKYYDMYNYQC